MYTMRALLVSQVSLIRPQQLIPRTGLGNLWGKIISSHISPTIQLIRKMINMSKMLMQIKMTLGINGA